MGIGTDNQPKQIMNNKPKQMIDKVSNKFNAIAYVRPTEKCNLRCKHCFIPPNPSAMSDEQILDIPMQLSAASVSGNVLLQWHGGEPLLMDPVRCEQLIVQLNSLGLAFNIKFLHGIQTNLVVLNGFSKNKRHEWYQVLSKYFELDLIGVSWDKAIRGINLRPPQKQKQNFYADFEQGIYALRASKYFDNDFSPVITITAAKPFLKSISNLPDSTIFFKWLKRIQLHKIHIEKLTPTGDALKNWKEIGVSNLEYSNAMSNLYLAYKRYRGLHPKSQLAISPFCDLEESITTGQQDNICASGACQTSLFTFSSIGMTKTCTAIAQIAQHNLLDLKNYQDGVKAHCTHCEFNNLCNGGCPAHHTVVDESGECSGAKKLLTTIKQSNNHNQIIK
jgi:radical SAM protein with 4Fe4S-binding SPASM domain